MSLVLRDTSNRLSDTSYPFVLFCFLTKVVNIAFAFYSRDFSQKRYRKPENFRGGQSLQRDQVVYCTEKD